MKIRQAYGQGVFEILAQEECRTICVGKVVEDLWAADFKIKLLKIYPSLTVKSQQIFFPH